MNGTMPAPVPQLVLAQKIDVPDASEWTIEDVVKFFQEMGFSDQADVFREQVSLYIIIISTFSCYPRTFVSSLTESRP